MADLLRIARVLSLFAAGCLLFLAGVFSVPFLLVTTYGYLRGRLLLTLLKFRMPPNARQQAWFVDVRRFGERGARLRRWRHRRIMRRLHLRQLLPVALYGLGSAFVALGAAV